MKARLKTQPEYNYISYQEAKANPEYARMLEPMFEEQAARILQRKWRKKKKLKNTKKYSETLNGPLSLRFIKEPLDEKATLHAQQINTGNWLKLEFDEPDFIRNLYKAFREKKISQNNMVTAALLHDARREFAEEKESKYPTIQEFKFEKKRLVSFTKRPYDPKNIDYADSKDLKEFYRQIKTLPLAERKYFCINLPKKRSISFLYDAVNHRYLQKEHYRCIAVNSFLKKYIERLNLPRGEKRQWQKELPTIHFSKLANFIKAMEPDYVDWLKSPTKAEKLDDLKPIEKSKKDRGSSGLLVAIFATLEQLPTVTISPDYNSSDPNSPLLCLILPTISAFNLLQRILHKEDMSSPFFVVGQVSTRFIRKLDESKNQSRPVELVHPDLRPNSRPHDVFVHPFTLSWHDLFHCWRNGSNPFKPLFRYIRQVLTNEKKFDMSRAVWDLTDMDFSQGHFLRSNMHFGDARAVAMNKKNFLSSILEILDFKRYLSEEESDNALLILIDIIINRDRWIALFGTDPEIEIRSTMTINTHVYSEVMDTLKNIIKADITNGQKFHSYKYYILVFRLGAHPDGIKLCDQLEKIGFDKILLWDRNKGLYFRPGFSGSDLKFISHFSPKSLFNILNAAENKLTLETKETILEKKPKDISQFFLPVLPIPQKQTKESLCLTLTRLS